MQAKCYRCGVVKKTNPRNVSPETKEAWEKYRIYFCRKCKSKIILGHIKNLVNNKKEKNANNNNSG